MPISLAYVDVGLGPLDGLVLGDAPVYPDFTVDRVFESVLAEPYSFATWDESFAFATAGSRRPDRAVFERVRHRWFRERDGRIVRLLDRDAIARTIVESRGRRREYWDVVAALACPALLLAATAGWTPLVDADVERCRASRVRVAPVAGGHDLGIQGPGVGDTDPTPLYDSVGAFLSELD